MDRWGTEDSSCFQKGRTHRHHAAGDSCRKEQCACRDGGQVIFFRMSGSFRMDRCTSIRLGASICFRIRRDTEKDSGAFGRSGTGSATSRRSKRLTWPPMEGSLLAVMKMPRNRRSRHFCAAHLKGLTASMSADDTYFSTPVPGYHSLTSSLL